mgnify:CR=1 FL=1
MANLCSTIYKCVGDEKELSELYNLIKKSCESGNISIYSILKEMGFDHDNLGCRGDIIYYDFSDNILTIDQSTAWCEQEDFRICIESKYPDVKVFYEEEEPGCDVYYTNDMTGDYFPERFLLDGEDVHEYFSNAKDAIDYLRDEFGINASGETEEEIQAAIDEYAEEQGDDFWMNIHEFKYVEE